MRGWRQLKEQLQLANEAALSAQHHNLAAEEELGDLQELVDTLQATVTNL